MNTVINRLIILILQNMNTNSKVQVKSFQQNISHDLNLTLLSDKTITVVR